MLKKSVLVFVFVIILFQIGIIFAEEDISPPVAQIIPEISLEKIIPNEFGIGDAQFGLEIKNNKNESISNLIASISGEGYSTYYIVPIENLSSNEKGYILVSGNFKKAGEINLTIRLEEETFLKSVSVVGNTEDLEDLKKKAEEKEMFLKNLTDELNDLKKNFNSLEEEFALKKEDYDISLVNLNDLSSYIKNTQMSILAKDVVGAGINLDLALEEYQTQRTKLGNAPEISMLKKIRENALIFSTIAGSVITFFALYELLKRKEEHVVSKIKNIKKKKKNK